MLVLQQMFIFLLLMLVGIAARRKGFLTDANQPQITQIVMNIAYPAIILSSVTGDGPHIEGMELLRAVGVILALLALMLLAGLYNKGAYQTSVKGVALSTLVAVVTMPIVAFLTGLG